MLGRFLTVNHMNGFAAGDRAEHGKRELGKIGKGGKHGFSVQHPSDGIKYETRGKFAVNPAFLSCFQDMRVSKDG